MGRYVLEDGEHVDVLIARSVPTLDGHRVTFDEVWARHDELVYEDELRIGIPIIDDLILTKPWSMRDKDVADIRLLEGLKRARGE